MELLRRLGTDPVATPAAPNRRSPWRPTPTVAFDFEHEPDQYLEYLEQEASNGFEFGLERLLDGIEAYLGRSGSAVDGG